MHFSIFLFILSSVQTIFCSQSNVTVDDTCDLCTISWLRRKRRQADYTRWRANQETTEEFIVKVMDDDFITGRTQKIVAINIQPLTMKEKKMIVGGPLMALTTPATTFSGPIDYTRFIPPTTIPREHDITNIRLDDPVILPRGPKKSENEILHNKHAAVKHIHRDESPPSGPQFLGRTQGTGVRQYAPVAPVSFNRGSTIAPLTPRSVERFVYKTPFHTPSGSRTLLSLDVIKPSRTSSKTSFSNIIFFDSDYAPDDQILVSRSSLSPTKVPQRTLSSIYLRDQDESFGRTTENNYPQTNKEDKLSGYKLFDIDKDNEYEIPLVDLELPKNINNSLEYSEDSDNSTESDSSIYGDDSNYSENVTLKQVPMNKSTTTRVAVTRTSLTGAPKIHKRRQTCNLVKLRQLNFNSPRTLAEIVAQLKQWAETSPVAKWVDITNGNYTTMENPIYMMVVDDPSSGQIISAKKTVLVIAGIQGRDHHAVAAAMYLLYQLIERNEAHADLLTKYRFWVIPIFNPDGYDYSMTFPHRREWAKNLRQKWDSCKGRGSCEACESFGLRCTIQSCYGVNLDRNFEYQWIPTEELRAEHPCGTLYAGERQLSELETRALTQFLHEHRTHIFTFVAFKEGEVLGILYPYSHTRKRRAFDNVYLRELLARGSGRPGERTVRWPPAGYLGPKPIISSMGDCPAALYAGGIEDWADGHLGIDNTYTIMMFRPTDSYNSKLITEHVVHEAYAALDTLLLQSADSVATPALTLATSTGAVPPIYSKLIMVAPIYVNVINISFRNLLAFPF